MEQNSNIRSVYAKDVMFNLTTGACFPVVSKRLATSKKTVKVLTSEDNLRGSIQVAFLKNTIWNSMTQKIIPEWSG